MSSPTTIAIRKEVQKSLLNFIHILEKKKGNRLSYSDAIKFLLDSYQEK